MSMSKLITYKIRPLWLGRGKGQLSSKNIIRRKEIPAQNMLLGQKVGMVDDK